MTDMTRDEIAARFKACEARTASALDGIRVEQAALRADVKTDIGGLRLELRDGFGAIRSAIAALPSGMHRSLLSHAKWTTMIAFTALAAIVSILGMLR